MRPRQNPGPTTATTAAHATTVAGTFLLIMNHCSLAEPVRVRIPAIRPGFESRMMHIFDTLFFESVKPGFESPMMHIFDTLFFESATAGFEPGLAHIFSIFSNPSDSTRVRTRVGTHVFRIPAIRPGAPLRAE